MSIKLFGCKAALTGFVGFCLLRSAGTLAEVCPVFEAPLASANAGCLIVEQGQVLMLKQWNAKWALPGGTAEVGEAAQCTAMRETWEETGLKVDVGELIHIYDNGFHLFSCERQVGQPMLNKNRPFTFEVLEVAWMGVEQFDDLNWRFSNQRQVIETWLTAVHHIPPE